MRCYCVLAHGEPLTLVDRPIPRPSGSEVLVKVRASGLCHTDLHLWEGHYDLGGGKKLTLAERGIKPPLTLSHEIVGTIEAAGEAATADVAALLGKPLLVYPWIGCGECAACRRGEENICIKPQSLGVTRPGGFAEYLIVPHPRYLMEIGELEAAQAAPLACAGVTTYSALKKLGSRIHEGPVVVIGAGGLGLMAVAVLKAMNGHGAVVVDIDPAKRHAALAAGALHAIDAQASDAVAQLQSATGGGARAVLDLVGATPTVSLAIASAARGAHIVICGLMGGNLTIALPLIPMRPLTLQGSYVGTLQELRELMALVQRTQMNPIPVSRRPLAEVNDALRALHEGKVIGRTVLIPESNAAAAVA